MTTADAVQARSRRNPARPGEAIDREREITFTFNGRSITAHPGDTIASALAAAGVDTVSRSFKYHRPRGLFCCAGHCPNCLVQVGDEPNVRACTRPAEAGLAVTAQNAWPSLDRDLMSLTALGDRFMPVGFYYKTFIRPRRLWPTFEHVLRHAAGLGRVNIDSTPDEYDKEYVHADVVVVGGGPAGLAAARAAAETGARVALFDENPAFGGHLRYSAGEAADPAGDVAALTGRENVALYPATTVLGWYEENWLAAMSATRLYKIRAATVVFATGAYEQPLIFDNNDLPGVMLAGAAQRLLHLYGVRPGDTAVVVTANDDGWRTAVELRAAGVDVAAVVDERADPPALAGDALPGARRLLGHTVVAARGKGRVRAVVIAPVDAGDGVDSAAAQTIPCDLLVLSVAYAPASGLLYQAGAAIAFDHDRGEFRPRALPAGIFAAGRVAGTHDLARQRAEGALAGQAAAAYVGFGDGPPPDAWDAIAADRAAEPRRTSTRVLVPGHGKRFVCLCEDVTDKDLEMAIAEGYDSIELLKRYSTISMGPCQGKMCSLNTIHLCSRANGWTIEETGTTTARPPMTPVKLGVLAGQNMEPVRHTPLHDWHVAQGAKMMVAGLWLRPEHYGDAAAEVGAVREAVGLIDVSTLGKMRLTGPGVAAFLDKVYVNRWRRLGVGRVRYGIMCNGEGVIMDDGVTAHVRPDDWYMTTTSSGAGAVYEWLQWWLQSGWGDGVRLADVTEQYAAFNLAGPRSRALLSRLTDADLADDALPYMGVADVSLAGVPARLMRIGFTGELSYEIHCPSGAGRFVWEQLMATGADLAIRPFGVEAQRVLRLEKGHIIVGQDTDALSDPLAADQGWAVKLGKEDFLGQRILRRVHADGPTQRLVGFKMARPGVIPDEGLQIVRPGPDGRLDIIGWVTSSRYSPTLGEVIGLCWLPADLAAIDAAPFTIRVNGRLVEAVVHHGPFYDPDGTRLRGEG